jgi:PAS domain S-box-containing protein
VILYDAIEQPPFSEDEYVRQQRARSVLCLPLMKQGVLGGVLYLENNLASHVFTPARLSVLEHLALQAAISLENASLFAELKQAEAFLVEAQRLSQTGSFGWNVTSGEILWSEEAFRLFGYDDAIRPNIDIVLSRVHPDDLSLVQEVINHATRDGNTIDFEHRLLMPNGTIKHVHAVARPVIDDPDNPRFVGALMDVTASKLAHAELERSEQRYRQLFQDIPVALWQLDSGPLVSLLDEVRAHDVTDLSRYIDDHPELLWRAAEVQNVIEVNTSAMQMFGARDRSELLGSLQWLFRESLDTFRRAIESRYRGEALFQETTRLTTRDGRTLDVLVTVVRPHYADHLAMTLMSMVDLTELARAQETLQRLQADFTHAARISMLGELTASIAHELGQPLAAITLNATAGLRWLDRPEPDLAELRATTQGIVANVKRAGDIITRIRGMAVHKQPDPQLISIDEAVLEALEFIRHEVQSRDVTILTDFARNTPKIRVDRVQFQQVIVNLTINAMQAMARKNSHESKITIRTRMFDVATVYCAVEDCGPGIVLDQAARIFDSFFTTKDDGMGMGLSVCRSIIEAHGGRIGANNDSVHGGACFYFTVPVAVVIN